MVEFAICLPVLTLLLMATLEANTMIFLKQSLTIAAYEGGRTALVPGATSADVTADCQQVLIDRGIQGATVNLNPNNIGSVQAGNYIEIVVTAPCNSNAILPGSFFQGRTMTGQVSVMKEYD